MRRRASGGGRSWVLAIAGLGCAADSGSPAGESATVQSAGPPLAWRVVVNNGDLVPGTTRRFNSYNQPSVNVGRLVVFRARSRGGMGGEPAHGVFVRDMAAGTAIATVFDRTTEVPQPNNLGTQFVEPPSFPRIDMFATTVASRGNHPPVWRYEVDGLETRAGTTGIYATPGGGLLTGASNLGAVPGFEYLAVPGTTPPVKFDVFPGAPAVTDGATIAFKANFTVDAGHETGVFYRDLAAAPIGGTAPVVVIADTSTSIPGTTTTFGSTAPPSAAGRRMVFAGFDNEEAPTLGGIYRAPLTGARPTLEPLVEIGDPVPGEASGTFNRIGEGLSFDGRFVGFWAAWGSATRSVTLACPTEGNAARIAYCNAQYPNGFTTTVPVNQGIFVHDAATGATHAVAKTPDDFDDLVYWNFSGRVPGDAHSDEDGEPARWRYAAFVAVTGLVFDGLSDPTFHVAYKARKGATDGLYLGRGPGNIPRTVLVETGMPATWFDPEAVGVDEETGEPIELFVTGMGVERDGFRGNALAVTISMGSEDEGWAGIYLTSLPRALR